MKNADVKLWKQATMSILENHATKQNCCYYKLIHLKIRIKYSPVVEHIPVLLSANTSFPKKLRIKEKFKIASVRTIPQQIYKYAANRKMTASKNKKCAMRGTYFVICLI